VSRPGRGSVAVRLTAYRAQRTAGPLTPPLEAARGSIGSGKHSHSDWKSPAYRGEPHNASSRLSEPLAAPAAGYCVAAARLWLRAAADTVASRARIARRRFPAFSRASAPVGPARPCELQLAVLTSAALCSGTCAAFRRFVYWQALHVRAAKSPRLPCEPPNEASAALKSSRLTSKGHRSRLSVQCAGR
jgi:hypothetical protein